jgi:gas vesicle protein
MKIMIKAKDFADKANLEKTLSTKLKKPVSAILKKTAEKLPFCYEVDYFSEGKGFMAIGRSNEVYKLFKTKRCKGQGVDERGKAIKIDKKKVAYGHVSLNDAGQFEFCVLGGIMKDMQAKKVIKSIPILKKMIGDNFVIVKGEKAAPAAEPTDAAKDTEDKNATPKEDKKETLSAAGKEVAKQIKTLIKSINSEMKNTVASVVVPNIKSKKVSDKDLNISVDLLDKIESLKELFDTAEDKVKNAYGKHFDKILTFGPKLVKIKNAIEKILPAVSDAVEDVVEDVTDAVDNAVDFVKKVSKEYIDNIPDNQNDSWFKKLLNTAKEAKETFGKELDDIEKSVKSATKTISSAIKGGADLLSDLF